MGPDSSVGTATGYRVNGLGIESRWGEILRTRPDRSCLLYVQCLPDLFHRGKAAGMWRWTSSTEFKERIEL